MLAPTSKRAFLLFFTCALIGFGMTWMPRAVVGVDQQSTEAKRKAMWASFKAKYPKESAEICVYGENPSATAILFRREQKSGTYEFSMKRGTVIEIQHMKAVQRVNRITFNADRDFSVWQLWYNGEIELILSAD